MKTRIFEYSIGVAGFIASIAIGYSYALQFPTGDFQTLMF